MSNEVDEIKQRLDLVEFISSYLTLKKAGSNHRALCPFHPEKTPSFMVSAEKQIWRCFGCNKGGDIFDFIMEVEGMEFGDALRLLAERAGVLLKPRRFEPKEEPSIKSRLYEINNLAARVYQYILLEQKIGQSALAYLTNDRGLSKETIKDFQLGLARSEWDFLLEYLKKKGFNNQELEQSGLFVKKENGGLYDRFRGRLMFPLSDVMGNVVGFSGRILPDEAGSGSAGKDQKDAPKYINSSDSPIFKKSRLLYGLDKAKLTTKKRDFTVLVEGQMDVIGSHQANVQNCVATSGTSLTLEHLEILKRYSPNVIFAFDQDAAGLEAARKAVNLSLKMGLSCRVATTTGFKDPGEMAIKSPNDWVKALRSSKPALDWHLDLALQGIKTKTKDTLSAEDKRAVARQFLPILKIVPDPIVQAHYLSRLSTALQVNEKILWQALEKFRSPSLPSSASLPSSLPPSLPKLTLAERLLGFFLAYPRLAALYQNDPLYTKIQADYNKESQAKKASVLVFSVEKETANLGEEEIKIEITSLIRRLKGEETEKLKEGYAFKIKEAESRGDREAIKLLLKELQDKIR